MRLYVLKTFGEKITNHVNYQSIKKESIMKKTDKGLLLRKAMAMFLLFVLCATNQSCEEHNHISLQRDVVEINVVGSDWQVVKNWLVAYHYYVAELPQLTEDVFRNGRIEVFHVVSNTVKVPLPNARVYTSGGAFFTEYMQYTIRLGEKGKPSTIEFMLLASDLSLWGIHPPDMRFRVVMER